MNLSAELAKERRARLAAERLLKLRQKELEEANAKLGRHANALTVEVVDRREEAEGLREMTSAALQELEAANNEVVIAKKRLWQSLETIQDGFAVFNGAGQMIIANSAYLAAFDNMELVQPGIAYADLLALAVDEGIVDTGDEAPAQWRARMLDRWNAPQPAPCTIRLWNGAYVRLIDQRAPNGDTTCLALNITESIRQEDRLRRATDRAQAASRAKSAFLARMSHELRTPMNGIVAMADLLAETGLDDEQLQFVDTIRSSANALLVLINDVLDFSKLEARKLSLAPEAFDLERLITEVARLFQPRAQAAGIELVLDYDVHLPTRFMGDHGRIRQILNNLVGNALKFTERGRIHLRVIGVELDDDQFDLRVTITDTGIGIAPDQLDHIFGEFNQVEDQKNRKYEGTGLGLAITRQLVELMEGQVWVDSELGRGSTFGFSLRLTALNAGERGQPPLPDWLKRVVLVSQGQVGFSILAPQLVAMGTEVVEAPGLDAALLDNLTSGDLIVLDLDRIDPAALRPCLEKVRDARIVGYVAGGQRLPDMGRRFPILTKPVNRVDLVEAIQQIAAAPESLAPADVPPAQETSPAMAEEPGAQPVSDHAATAPDAAGRFVVLAAEDNQTNRLVLEKMIGKMDIDLHFATDGIEAVEKWRALRPDLVLMDISMPRMDGKEATRAIRAEEERDGLPRTRIVALTAHAMAGDEKEILAAGLDHYLTKPLKKDLLRAQIAAVRGDDGAASPSQAAPPAATGGDGPGNALAAIDPQPLRGRDDGGAVAEARRIWDGLQSAEVVAQAGHGMGFGG